MCIVQINFDITLSRFKFDTIAMIASRTFQTNLKMYVKATRYSVQIDIIRRDYKNVQTY